MADLNKLTVEEALTGLKNKDFTASEVTQDCLNAINDSKGLNAYMEDTSITAKEQAQAAEQRYFNNNSLPLDGIPVAVKDLFCTKGYLSTSSSHILDGFKPEYESQVTANMYANGGIIIGKTNMDEFAMGSANVTSYYGNVINPWRANNSDKDIVPGGSSGGSASAVAANTCLASLGSDTGGSIRQPASFCGIVGVKPTYGTCSRSGMIAFASSLDQAGVLSKTVKDSALVLQSIAGHDIKDSTSSTSPTPDYCKDIGSSIEGMKIGIPKEYDVEGMPQEIAKLWQKGAQLLQEQGAEIIEISLPHTQYALPTYYIIAPAEASSNLARYDGVRYGLREYTKGMTLDEMYEATRSKGFGDEVKRRVMIGTYVLSAGYYDAYYKKAQKVRTLITRDFSEAYKQVDAILTPTTPSSAFAIGENEDDPIKMYLNDVLTVPASLAGLPAMSVPAGLDSKGLPLGLQLITNHFDEQNLFKIGAALESSLQFKRKV